MVGMFTNRKGGFFACRQFAPIFLYGDHFVNCDPGQVKTYTHNNIKKANMEEARKILLNYC